MIDPGLSDTEILVFLHTTPEEPEGICKSVKE